MDDLMGADSPDATMSTAAPGRHVVVTVHGMRTHGEWQRRLELLVGKVEPTCEFRHFRYGYFSVAAFIFPPTRGTIVRRFARELGKLVDARAGGPGRVPVTRLDIVGHSFGTHVLA